MLTNIPPVLYVFFSFLGVLSVYVVLALNGTATGVLDELSLLLGGAVAGVASPTDRKAP